MPRGGEVEAGLVSDQGDWRIAVSLSRGFDFDGGHLETDGIDPTGTPITVPLHRHVVEMELTRIETLIERRFDERWSGWLRIPFDVRDRTARIETIDPATPAEIAAMQRNLEVHHPDRTLDGFADLSVLAARRYEDVFADGAVGLLAFGTSVPVGQTENDPFLAGNLGLPHEHLQFGTGTFDPLLEGYWHGPVGDDVHLSASLLSRASLYENPKTYRGPFELNASLVARVEFEDGWAVRAGLSSIYQGYAHWNGVRDVNSGQISHGAVVGIVAPLWEGTALHLSARIPFEERTLSSQGDTFEYGPFLQLSVSRAFGRSSDTLSE